MPTLIGPAIIICNAFTKSTLHTARVNKKPQEIIFEYNLFARKNYICIPQ